MMEIDFEQRSEQIVQMALDRSKLLRISLIIWGIPIVTAATLLKSGITPSFFHWDISAKIIIGICFFFSANINSISLASQIGNGNTTNLAASGINYFRTIYFKILIDHGKLSLTNELKKVLFLGEEGEPTFRLIRSHSNELAYRLIAGVNILYSLVGVYVFYHVSTTSLVIGIVFLIISVFVNVITLLKHKKFAGY